MVTLHLRATVSLALVLVCCLSVLPGCKKKKTTSGGHDSGQPAGNPGGSQSGRGALSYSRPAAQGTFDNMKRIGLAFHNYHDATGSLPNAIADTGGKPGLSWRVAILPYLEQQNLYQQFKLNESWDSEHNKKLIAMMPRVYAAPVGATDGQTYYRSFTGQGAIMPPPAGNWKPGQPFRGLPLSNITDGTSNTLMVVEAAEPVIWTKPDELPFTPGKPPKVGGGVFAEGFHAVLCDGSVRFLKSSNFDARNLSNAIQTNDGQIVNID
jgi:hypothetical protein